MFRVRTTRHSTALTESLPHGTDSMDAGSDIRSDHHLGDEAPDERWVGRLKSEPKGPPHRFTAIDLTIFANTLLPPPGYEAKQTLMQPFVM